MTRGIASAAFVHSECLYVPRGSEDRGPTLRKPSLAKKRARLLKSLNFFGFLDAWPNKNSQVELGTAGTHTLHHTQMEMPGGPPRH